MLWKNWLSISIVDDIFSKGLKMFKRTVQVHIIHCLALAVVLQLCLCDDNSNLTTTTTKTEPAISEFDLIKNEVNVYDDMPRNSSSVKKQTPTYSTGNELWDNLIRDCLKKPTFSCIQKNVYTFLDTTMAVKDVNLTSKIQLTRNEVQYEIPDEPTDEENEIHFEGRGEN